MLHWIKTHKYALVGLYLFVFLAGFGLLELVVKEPKVIIHCPVDDWIPFCELFVIPYGIWFLYVLVVIVYLYFQKDHLEDYYHCVITLILGMSTCLLIYYLFPNEQNLRPASFAHPNLLTDIVSFIYASDTKTNVLPSIHVYNSIAIHIAFATSHSFRNRHGWRIASLLLCSLICLSTMFLKQHSFLDVITGLLLYLFYSALVYKLIPYLRQKRHSLH